MSDQIDKLVLQARKGDLEAASELITQFHERLYGWLRRLTGHDEDAADLTQKTFSKAWSSLDRFERRSSFSTWLHSIGHHVYLDWCRQRKRVQQPSETWWEIRPDQAQPCPSQQTADRDLSRQLYSLVEKLDEEARQTVHLHYYEGLSLSETATVLGIATSTVKYRLRQAVQSLRAGLAGKNLNPCLDERHQD